MKPTVDILSEVELRTRMGYGKASYAFNPLLKAYIRSPFRYS